MGQLATENSPMLYPLQCWLSIWYVLFEKVRLPEEP